MKYMRLGIYVSGNGSNLQAIIDAIKSSYLKNAKIVVVISNNNKSNALLRAYKAIIPAYYFDNNIIDIEGLKILQKYNVNLVILAGYLRKIGPKTLEIYKRKIINIHPSLLPRYSGKGMYGIKIHKKVMESGDKETGVTIHWVDEEYDTGSTIKQVRIPIYKNDTIQLLNKRILKIEHKIIIDTLIELNKNWKSK